ncbi:hypothetical protein GCM10009559_51710 [Pseudonocardia zijingensis]|uniref:Uncharacterized protein n=1 Tax=Pseudonocardia zijingensis TaxID=153376 RepID=A0ABN1N6R6_9PSEU
MQARDLQQRLHRSRIFWLDPGDFADTVEAIPNGAAMVTQSARGMGEVAAQRVIPPQRTHQHQELGPSDRCRAFDHLSVRGPPQPVTRISRRHDRYLLKFGDVDGESRWRPQRRRRARAQRLRYQTLPRPVVGVYGQIYRSGPPGSFLVQPRSIRPGSEPRPDAYGTIDAHRSAGRTQDPGSGAPDRVGYFSLPGT